MPNYVPVAISWWCFSFTADFCTRYLLMKVYLAVCFILRLVHSAAARSLQFAYWCVCCSLRVALACLFCVCPPLWVGKAAVKYIRQWKRKRATQRTTVLVNDSFSDTSSCGSSFDLSDDDENDPSDMSGGIPDLIPNPREHALDKAKLKLE